MTAYENKKVKIGGKVYTVIFVPVGVELPDFGLSENGVCDPPTKKDKRIYIREGLSEKREFDTLLHELLHAACWMASEEWVRETANEIAHIFYTQYNWRKTSD